MSGNKRGTMLFLSIAFQFFVCARSDSSTGNPQTVVQSSPIPLKSTTMENTFQDLIANLSMDDNDVTCASSDWVSSRSIDYNLENPAGIHEITLLMHKYVDVDLEVYVRNSTDRSVLCNNLQLNTGTERKVTVTCKQEIYGVGLSIKDMRNTNEFFVVCEANAYGVPSAVQAPPGETSGENPNELAKYIGIGCGAGLLVIVVVLVIVFFCRRNSAPRRSSEAHSLNTLSMMNSQHAVGGSVVRRQREPIPTPRPNVYSRSIPNPYDRPMSVKDTLTIYETIPGDEPPYLILVGEKDIYDDASSSKR